MYVPLDDQPPHAALLSQETKASMPKVPAAVAGFDVTEMEEDLRLMRRGPGLSYAIECQLQVKRRIKDQTVDWPEEALRREAIRRLERHGSVSYLLVARMNDSFCSFVTGRALRIVEAGLRCAVSIHRRLGCEAADRNLMRKAQEQLRTAQSRGIKTH